MNEIFDFTVIGAGASGLFALEGLKDKKVLILEGNKKVALKLLATGGGKCNFTNLNLSHENYVSENQHFVKSFLANFDTYDFLDLIEKNNIPYEERDNGKLFTLSGAKSILDILLKKGFSENHILKTDSIVENIFRIKNENQSTDDYIFKIETSKETFFSNKVLIATGGLSYPQMGATNIASKIAKNFGIKVIPMSPALAGIRYPDSCKNKFEKLSGIAITAKGKIDKREFTDQLLFTHRGFSGPLALNLSLFVNKNTKIKFNFIPEINVLELLQKEKNNKRSLLNILSDYIPKALVKTLLDDKDYNLPTIKKDEMEKISQLFNSYEIQIDKLDGYDKAEVTRGGISVDEIFPKTMEAKKVSGLYFIGEALDVTGMLGGYNLHWAWASASMFIKGLKKN